MSSADGAPRPLAIWSAPEQEVDMEMLRAAKASLDLDYKIAPVLSRIEMPWALRTLAIGTRPPWICDYYLIAPTASVQVWATALRWVLGEVDDDWDATMVIDTLSHIFGGPSREIPQQELDGEVRFRDYVQGRA